MELNFGNKVSEESIQDVISSDDDPEQYYELIEKVGVGAYGVVYKAMNKKTEQLVAIKIVPIQGQVPSLRREIAILRECKSEYIVRYLNSFCKENNMWLVMEYCGAGSIIDIMRILHKEHLSELMISVVLRYVLKGMQYLHKNKKIHRDIKAGNVLLDLEGRVKLADFGVSAQLQNTLAEKDSVIGTPFWMSPEVISKNKYTIKTDVWSLGITAIELAEGAPPYSHIHPIRALFVIQNKPPTGLTDPSLWSPEFNDFVKKCLVVNPDKRATTEQLMQHQFILKYQNKGKDELQQLVNEYMLAVDGQQEEVSNQQQQEPFQDDLHLNLNHKSNEIQNSQNINKLASNKIKIFDQQSNDTNLQTMVVKEDNEECLKQDSQLEQFYMDSAADPTMCQKKNKLKDSVQDQNQYISYLEKIKACDQLTDVIMDELKLIPDSVKGLSYEKIQKKRAQLLELQEKEIQDIREKHKKQLDDCNKGLEILSKLNIDQMIKNEHMHQNKKQKNCKSEVEGQTSLLNNGAGNKDNKNRRILSEPGTNIFVDKTAQAQKTADTAVSLKEKKPQQNGQHNSIQNGHQNINQSDKLFEKSKDNKKTQNKAININDKKEEDTPNSHLLPQEQDVIMDLSGNNLPFQFIPYIPYNFKYNTVNKNEKENLKKTAHFKQLNQEEHLSNDNTVLNSAISEAEEHKGETPKVNKKKRKKKEDNIKEQKELEHLINQGHFTPFVFQPPPKSIVKNSLQPLNQ